MLVHYQRTNGRVHQLGEGLHYQLSDRVYCDRWDTLPPEKKGIVSANNWVTLPVDSSSTLVHERWCTLLRMVHNQLAGDVLYNYQLADRGTLCDLTSVEEQLPYSVPNKP